MSRKWERMVRKNQKTVNHGRVKRGLGSLPQVSRGAETVIKGRSWMLASVLAIFAILYFILTYQTESKTSMYWITGFSYIALAVLYYLVRRPVIKISRQYVTVRRFTGDKLLEPKDIEGLVLNPGHVVIQLKGKQKKLIYTKLQHRFPMEELNARLREFAQQHKLDYRDETR
ncbi:hypothetical protein [Gorillibacterium sp. sgz5001074]|uniref:hypothetical protein n=1 Tax=Gorillibacterium sp. sgz5001074 TaxID=3446695 RepID=UPI003F675FD9